MVQQHLTSANWQGSEVSGNCLKKGGEKWGGGCAKRRRVTTRLVEAEAKAMRQKKKHTRVLVLVKLGIGGNAELVS